MAIVTLMDMINQMPEGPEKAILYTYATANPVFSVMGWKTTGLLKEEWKISDLLSQTGSSANTRILDADYTASKTLVQPYETHAVIVGGKFNMDRVLLKANPAEAARQMAGLVTANSVQTVKDIFEGAGGSYLYGIRGLIEDGKVPYLASQYVDNGSSTTSTVITADKLDQVLSKVNVTPNTRIYCSSTVFRLIQKLTRDATAYNTPESRYGIYSGLYSGIPVIPLVDGKGEDMLTTNLCSSTDGTTLFVVSFGEDMFEGIQAWAPETYPIVDGTTQTLQGQSMDWPIMTAAKSRRSVAILRYIKHAMS